MVWLPTDSPDVMKVALPPLRNAVPSVVVPSVNVTDAPPGVPAPGATTATVAVMVTIWPKTDGLGADVRVVVVPALPMVWLSVPVAPLKFALPE